MAFACTALPKLIEDTLRGNINSMSGLLSPSSNRPEPRAAADTVSNYTAQVFPLSGEALVPSDLPNVIFNDSLVFEPSANWVLPATLSFCNDSSAPDIDPGIVSRLFKGPLTSGSFYNLLRNQNGMIWGSRNSYNPHSMGTQIFICNYGTYDVAYSGAEYSIVNDMLNSKCGNKGGWVFFVGWKLWVGRDVTNADGTYRAACGYDPN